MCVGGGGERECQGKCAYVWYVYVLIHEKCDGVEMCVGNVENVRVCGDVHAESKYSIV